MATQTPTTTRRALLVGAAAIAPALAIPAAIASQLPASSRMAELFADWKRKDAALRALPDKTPFVTWRPYSDEARLARLAIVREPARTLDDWMLKVCVAATTAGGVEGIEEALDEDISTGNAFDTTLAMSALRDLVNGVEGLPRFDLREMPDA